MIRRRGSVKSAEAVETAPILSALLVEATARLRAAGLESPRREATSLAAHVLALGREAMVAAPDQTVAAGDAQRFLDAVSRRAVGEPFARIAGHREFWSLNFILSADTLVPRPETETVVELVLESIPDRAAALSILDLGTGSGCILLALLSELENTCGTGIDISEAALETARENARRLGLDGRATFMHGDWTQGLTARFDVIVANPPYVAETDRGTLMVEVRDHDPARALFAGADGLEAFRTLIPGLAGVLAPGGLVALECGAGQGPKVAAMLAAAGLEAGRIVKDLAGHDRVVTARGKS
jgi:release factor glutamine methyltransferase